MHDALLVINTGSSSVKFAVYHVDEDRGTLTQRYVGEAELVGDGRGQFTVSDRLAREPVQSAVNAPIEEPATLEALLQTTVAWLKSRMTELNILAVGHRVVHGGEDFRGPVRVDTAVRDTLEQLIPLAPLHQPYNLVGIQVMADLLPGTPQIACFDTAFHATQPDVTRRYALPRPFWDEGIKAYGFHGLSYEYIVGLLPAHLKEHERGRVVIAHLGNGASVCGVQAGKSVASTMGMTALDGLMMGTRCGALDPGVVLHLLKENHLTVDEVGDLLYRHSGLLGVSGISADVRELLRSEAPAAHEALALFCYRVRLGIAAMAAAVQGMDALVFTGGIGSNAYTVRREICRGLAWMGVELDQKANEGRGLRVSMETSRVSVWQFRTDEEAVIARQTLASIAAAD